MPHEHRNDTSASETVFVERVFEVDEECPAKRLRSHRCCGECRELAANPQWWAIWQDEMEGYRLAARRR